MEIIILPEHFSYTIAQLRHNGNKIGFVPTMGALHQGHISLLKYARTQTGTTVCSIFVNPAQFNNAQDLALYPRTLAADLVLLEAAGVDIVFVPEATHIFPSNLADLGFSMSFGLLDHTLEGHFRPNHFAGVGLIVAKLFNLIGPCNAYFGLKDLQQCAVIERLVSALSFDVELEFCPTIREADGLAMSSRNQRLSASDRLDAPKLYTALCLAQKLSLEGYNADQVHAQILDFLEQYSSFKLEYFSFVCPDTFQDLHIYKRGQPSAWCAAGWLSEVRLIDNLIF